MKMKTILMAFNSSTMKSLFKTTIIAAMAVFAFAACKSEKEAPVIKHDVHFVLKAKMPQTKTGVMYDEGSYEPYFMRGDELGILFNLPTSNGDLHNDAVFANTQEDGEDAAFEGTVSLAEGEGIQFYSYYPASSGKKVYVSEGIATLGLDVPTAQTPYFDDVFGYSFDPEADILIAKPATCAVFQYPEYNKGANEVDMYFARLSSVARIALNMAPSVTGYGEQVSKFTLETSQGDIAGRIVVNPITGECTKVNSLGTSKKIVASYNVDDVPVYVGYESTNNVFLCTAPVTIPAGSTLTFTVETVNAEGADAHKIVKTIASTPKDIVFRSSEPTVINLNIVESEVSSAGSGDGNDYSGDYLITNTDHTFAAKAWASTDYNLKTASITFTNDQVTYDDDVNIENCKMTITKVANGTYAGMYTIQDANGLYLHPASSSSNHLKGYSAEELDKNGYWTISNTEGVWKIIADKAEYTRNEMRFNNNIVACYSTGQSPVDLVSWSKVVMNTTPQIIVAEPTKSVAADAQSVDFAYTTKNIEGNPTATITTDANHIVNGTPVVADGTVTVSLNPNTVAQEKSAIITLSYTGAQDVTLTINQAAYCEWILVTDASVLTAGDQLIIASTDKGKVANTSLTSGYFGESSAVFTSNGISSLPNDALILTLGGESGAWTLSNASNQKLGATAVKVLAFNSEKTNWSITIGTDGDATIQNETSSYGRILHNVTNTRFTTYTSNLSSSMLLPQLYRKPGVPDERTEVTMSFSPAEPAAITLGDNFTEPTLTVDPEDAPIAYSVTSQPEGIATINSSTGKLNITAVGTITVTASVTDEENYKPASASYTLTVNAPIVVHGSVDDPMTVAEVLEVISALENKKPTEDFYYVEGTLKANPTNFSSSTGKMRFIIVDDNNNEITAYNCLGLNGANFTSQTDLKAGDYVIVYGNLEKYDSTPEIVNGQLAKLIPYSGGDPGDDTTAGVTIASYASSNSWTNETKYSDVTIDSNITACASGGANTGKYYLTDNTWRFYANENAQLTIEASNNHTIKTVKVTFTTKDNGVLKNGSTTVSSGAEVNVNATSIVFSISQSSGNKGKVFVTAIDVTYN